MASLSHIKKLVEKAQQNAASVEELEELLDWLSSKDAVEYGDLIDEVLAVDMSRAQNDLKATGVDIDRLVDDILSSDKLSQDVLMAPGSQGQGKRARIRYIQWWIAAGFVLFAALSGVIYQHMEQQRQRSFRSTARIVQPDSIQPGSDKAVLTLDDGRRIDLSGTGNGILATENGVDVHKVDNGELVYAKVKNCKKDNHPHFNTMSTPRGGKYAVVLPDGTKVWLNAASSITYPTHFMKDSRQVTMKGEAYFEVTKDPKRPFIVRTDHQMSVKVYGTHFNIDDYGTGGIVRTTLLEGSVSVNNASGQVLLQPGQQSSMDKKGVLRLHKGIDLDKVMAWKQNLFYFSRQDIKSIMDQVSLWYDVEIRYKGPVPVDLFSAIISRENKIDDLLGILQATGKVHFTIAGKIITVSSKEVSAL